jgi:hypothetical protein
MAASALTRLSQARRACDAWTSRFRFRTLLIACLLDDDRQPPSEYERRYRDNRLANGSSLESFDSSLGAMALRASASDNRTYVRVLLADLHAADNAVVLDVRCVHRCSLIRTMPAVGSTRNGSESPALHSLIMEYMF